MKSLYKVSVLQFLAASLMILSVLSCSKDDSDAPKLNSNAVLKGSVSATPPATKTQHEYSDKTLKVRWNNGDEIAVSDGTELYKFTQAGSISDDGHTALFSIDSTVSFAEGEIIAVYPYVSDLSYNLTSQEGNINNLFQTDLLLAKAKVTGTKIEDLVFKPVCTVLRLPKDMIITDEDYSGEIRLTISGNNVGGRIIISKTGGIEVIPEKISFRVGLIHGKLSNDAYITFLPIDQESSDIYFFDSERGDHFEVLAEKIATSNMYTVKNQIRGFVDFKDENFKTYCVRYFDLNQDGEISFAEAKMIKKIIVYTEATYGLRPSFDIKSLGGIEYFENLTYLKCSGTSASSSQYEPSSGGSGKLIELDVSKNLLLDTLICSANQLTQLDISCNKKLSYLDCGHNMISQLDVSNNMELTNLGCESNLLANLIITNNPTIRIINCTYNKLLTQLDVSNNKSLKQIYSSYSAIDYLDVSGDISLEILNCSYGSINQLLMKQCAKLTDLDCSVNELEELRLEDCHVLAILKCSGNNLTELCLNSSSLITYLDCGSNYYLSSLDVSNQPSLEYLNCSGNVTFTALDLSNNLKLKYLYCSSDQVLTSLDLSNNTELKELECGHCYQLSSLKVSNNPKLTIIDCRMCFPLTLLDVSSCTSLEHLCTRESSISSLDVSNNSLLKTINAWWGGASTCHLKTLTIKKGNNIKFYDSSSPYYYRGTDYCNPTRYGTTIVEVD